MEKKDIITCLNKIKKRLKEYQKNYRETKKHISQMQICQLKCITKLLLRRYFLFGFLLIFER